jgi:hypothetical protein
MRFSHAHDVLLCERKGIAGVYGIKTQRFAEDGVDPDSERRKKTELAVKQRDSQSGRRRLRAKD